MTAVAAHGDAALALSDDSSMSTSDLATRGAGFVAVVSALLLPTIYLADSFAPWETGKRAVLIAAFPLGAAFLSRRVLQRDVAASLVVALLCWMMVTSATSGAPWPSLVGVTNRHTSVLFFAGAVGLWAVGAATVGKPRRMLGWVFLSGSLVSGIVAMIQLLAQPSNRLFGLDFGRPTGLAGAAPFLGTHMAMVVMYLAAGLQHDGQEDRLDVRLRYTLFGVFCFLATLSGSRIGLAVSLVAVVLVLLPRNGRHRYAAASAAGIGLVAAVVVHAVAADQGQSSAERVTSGGVADRLYVWRLGARAFVERPIVGWGSGRFNAATMSRASDDWIARFPSDVWQGWTDSHNLLVEFAVTTGLPGLLLLVAFVVTAVRHATGPYAWMAAAAGAALLLEPANAAVLGPGMLFLGAAAPCRQTRSFNFGSAAPLGAVIAGLILAGSYVYAYSAPAQYVEPGSFPSWYAPWLAADPVALSRVGISSLAFEQRFDGRLDSSSDIFVWTKRSAEVEPDVPTWWALLGAQYLAIDEPEEAEFYSRRALAFQENHVLSLHTLAALSESEGDFVNARLLKQRLCEVNADFGVCDQTEVSPLP